MDGVSAVVVSPCCRQGALRGVLPVLARLFVLSLVFVAGCRPSSSPISGTHESADALAREVLSALASRDRARLESLALSEAEFRARVWPELPASRPERNLTADYVWQDLDQKSRASLQATLARLGGRRLDLKRVEFRGETTEYRTFSVSREAELVVADADGVEQRVRVFGSVLHDGDRVKIFSYVVD